MKPITEDPSVLLNAWGPMLLRARLCSHAVLLLLLLEWRSRKGHFSTGQCTLAIDPQEGFGDLTAFGKMTKYLILKTNTFWYYENISH